MEETKSNMNIKRDYKNISPLMAEESKLPIRPILKKPYYQLVQSLNEQRTNQKFLFQAFCGIGKSRPMYNLIFDCYNTYDLIVFVFPFINLLTQFKDDYISRIETDKQFKILSICSVKEKGRVTKITTNPVDIKATLSSNKKKIILVTYQSLKTLYDCLENRIDLCIFDEAHHSVGKESKSLIYTNPKYDNAVFFTATPANKHGITMYEEGIDSHCGKRIVNATFIDGLNSDTLVPFEIRGNIMNNQNHDVPSKINRIYEIIIRNIFLTGNNRVLTFHTYANSNDTSTSSYGDSDFDSNVESDIESDFSEESAKVEVVEEKKETKLETEEETEEETEYNFKTNVQDFVNEALFSSIFKDIKKEFFELRNKYKKITFKAMTAKTSLSIRNKWLRELDNANDDEIYIISSCKTIGEGVDTKNVNHIVFVDSKSSYIDIIQNIGRGVRKTDQKHRATTITIPSFINYERYRGADTEEKRDETIRSGIAKYDDFSGIMNVLSAIQQEDEEYYKMCLQYPNKLFKREVARNLETQDKYMSETGKQLESITGVEREENETEEDYLNRVAVQSDGQIELHTNDIDSNIKYYGDESKPISSRIYKDDESLENNYYEIEDKGETQNKKSKQCIRHKITNIKIKYDDEFKVLWHIEEEMIKNQVSSCILNFSLSGSYCIDKWKARLKEVEKFAVENERLPSSYKRNKNEEIKKLGTWIDTQKSNYSPVENERKEIMKNNEIASLWKQFMGRHQALFLTNEEGWKATLEQVEKFVIENRMLPSFTTDKANEEIKKLGKWLSHQKQNYSQVQSNRKFIMKNNEITSLWEQFMGRHPTLFKNEASTQEQKVDYTNLEKYTVQQLKTICSTLNVAFASKTKKAELIELIKAKVNNTPPSPQTKHPSQPTKPYPKTTKVKTTTQKETKEEETKNQNRTQSKYQKLTHKMAVQASSTTNTMFKNEPALWEKYHSSRDISFKGYDNQDEIPVNKIIKYLETKNKRRLKILDLGCGRNKIKDHFKSNLKFTVVGYDHVAYNGSIAVDISSLPDEYESVNMCIFSQSLMGSNWVDYLIEAKRVLMYGGEIIISESHNRFEDIKTKLIELGFGIKREELNQTENTVERWFYIIAINE
jgi:superfamily II DNA or RNA helicase